MVGVLLLLPLVLSITFGKYQTKESIKLAEGTIKNYSPYDFKLLAVKLENESGEYVNSNTIPTTGYVLNSENSYCTIPNENGNEEKDNNIIINYHDGVISFDNIVIRNTKCYLYFDILKQVINYTMLYDYGNECIDITGGWSGSQTKSANSLYAAGGGNSPTYLSKTINSFDISKWQKVFVRYQFYSTEDYTNDAALYVVSVTSSSNKVVGQLSHGYSDAGVQNINGIETFDISSDYDMNEYYFVNVMTRSAWSTVSSWHSNTYAIAVLNSDNWLRLAEIIGISATSINDIIEYSTTLLSNEEAIIYMIHNCTGDFMASALQSERFMNALNASEYKDLVYGNEHWAKFLSMIE